jgi:hydrogenase maturation protease
MIAGIGSPHGDDQAGWCVADGLLQGSCPARVLALNEPIQLVDHLAGCQWLLVVDACQSGASPGAISHLVWPDERIEFQHDHSSHGIGVGHALRLAEQLGRLPPRVEVFGIQVADCSAGSGLCDEVREAVQRLTDLLLEELGAVSHA